MSVLLYEVKDEIAFITMNRPEKLNALNGALSNAVRDAWKQFEADPTAKVAIFSGKGKAFCAGADMTPGAIDPDVPFQTHQAYPANGISIFKPIVGAVQGYAFGAGYALAVRGCDITIAGESCVLGFPEGKVGIPLPPVEYVPYMPFKKSLEFMLLAYPGGRLIPAPEALDLGLVNAVVPDEQLMEEAIRWAELLKQVPPLYIKTVKYGHYKTTDNTVRVHEREYIEYLWPQMVSEDRKEAQAAHKARRKPSFKGK